MRSNRREQELLDQMWDRVRPLLPSKPPHPYSGRPFADDKACFAGIVYQLRNNVRWNDLSDQFPPGVTCWRRHRGWTRDGVWERVWIVVLEELAVAGLLDMTELFLDATFDESRKGGHVSAAPAAAWGWRSSSTARASRSGWRRTRRAYPRRTSAGWPWLASRRPSGSHPGCRWWPTGRTTRTPCESSWRPMDSSLLPRTGRTGSGCRPPTAGGCPGTSGGGSSSGRSPGCIVAVASSPGSSGTCTCTTDSSTWPARSSP